jgi:putative flavoprotein involved in K+ transport
MTPPYDVLLIGGGQAGLAAGYHLRRAGLSFAILEGRSDVGGSWPHYYDSLRLFSPAGRSSLPGMPFPGRPQHYPARDEVVAYLRHYVRHFALPIVTDARVLRVERTTQGFRVITSGGTIYHAHSIIAATGAFYRPYMPWTYASATIRGVGPDAAYIVQQVQRQLRAVEPRANQRVGVIQRVFGSWRCCTGKEGAV